ncbi:jmjC domain containing protein, partial [Aphelenchoides avenae]
DLEAVPVTFAPKGRKRRKSYASTRSKGRIVKESSKLASQQIEKRPEAYDFNELLEHDRFANDGVVRRMPAKGSSHTTGRMHFSLLEFTAQYVRDSGLIQPLLFEDAPEALGMSVLQSEKFTLHKLAKLIPGNRRFRLLDDGGHKSPSVSLKAVAEDCEKPQHKRALPPGEILIEGWNTILAEMITPPKVVSELDWVERYWPKELKQRQDLQGNDYGWRQKHCIINTKGCFFDFFVPFAGTAVWYHVLQGTLVSWLVEPSEENVRLFEDWYSQPCSSSANGPRPFFGDLVDKCTRLRMEAGSTVVIPSGWIRCDYATEDTVAVGGHFLHSYAMPQQIRALESEKKRRIPANYCYQFAPQLLWYYVADVVHKATGRQYRGPIAVDPRQEDDIPDARLKQHTSPNQVPGVHEGLGNQAGDDRPLGLPRQVCYDVPQPDDWIVDVRGVRLRGFIVRLEIRRDLCISSPAQDQHERHAFCQPVESFNDEFVSSLTRRERIGLFSLLSYLKRLAMVKKPVFAEGITRPRHLLHELE